MIDQLNRERGFKEMELLAYDPADPESFKRVFPSRKCIREFHEAFSRLLVEEVERAVMRRFAVLELVLQPKF